MLEKWFSLYHISNPSCKFIATDIKRSNNSYAICFENIILYIFSQKQLKFILEGVLIIAYVSNLNLMLDCDFLRLRISYPFENIAEMSIQKC